MPIYEYQCRACERDFEHFARSVVSEEKVACPECKSTRVQRRLSLFAAHQGGASTSMPPSPCDRCGEAPGSCAMRGGL